MGGARSTYRGEQKLVVKAEGKRPPGRRRRSWEDNINTDLE